MESRRHRGGDRGPSRRYGAVEAVSGLDLTIEKGSVVALLGPNGAGKTTTIECVLGLKQADEGRMVVVGIRPRGGSARTRRGDAAGVGSAFGRDGCGRSWVWQRRSTEGEESRSRLARVSGSHGGRGPGGHEALRRAGAASPLRDGDRGQPRAPVPRRADDRNGRREPRALLEGDQPSRRRRV